MFHLRDLPGTEKDEKILLQLRRHPFILIKSSIGLLILGFLPIIFYYILGATQDQAFSSPTAYLLIIMGVSVFYLGILVFLFNSFLDYYLDIWVVTNHRIINIEQKNLFNRVVSEQALYRVQDVTAEQKGIIPSFLRYGTITVQSAAEEKRFVFKDVPRAFENGKKIQELVLRDKEMHPYTAT